MLSSSGCVYRHAAPDQVPRLRQPQLCQLTEVQPRQQLPRNLDTAKHTLPGTPLPLRDLLGGLSAVTCIAMLTLQLCVYNLHAQVHFW